MNTAKNILINEYLSDYMSEEEKKAFYDGYDLAISLRLEDKLNFADKEHVKDLIRECKDSDYYNENRWEEFHSGIKFALSILFGPEWEQSLKLN